jgi:hypothetical protein
LPCARRWRSSRLTRWWTRKESLEKGGQGGEEVQGVADTSPQKKSVRIAYYIWHIFMMEEYMYIGIPGRRIFKKYCRLLCTH